MQGAPLVPCSIIWKIVIGISSDYEVCLVKRKRKPGQWKRRRKEKEMKRARHVNILLVPCNTSYSSTEYTYIMN
jgi:hypothetical protein